MKARQSTARTFMIGPVLDADGVAVTTAVVGDFKVSKNGGAPAALNGSTTLTHRHTGNYSLAAATGDFDTVGTAQFTLDKTTDACAPVSFDVVEEAIYDAMYAASANAFQGAAGSTKVTGVVLVDTLTTYTGNTPQTGDSYAIVSSGTHGNAALKSLIDAVDNFVDTEIGDIQARLPAALTADGNMKADTLRVGGTLQTAGDLAALITTVDNVVDTILVDTNELQTDWANGGRLDLLLDAAKENTDYPEGYVYLDEDAGAAGTTVGTNGTARNPVDSWADANTIAVARGRKAVKNAPGGTMIIASGTFFGYDIDLNGGSMTLDDGVAITGSLIHSTAKTGRIYETNIANPVVIGQGCFLDNLFLNGFAPSHPQVYVTKCGFYGDIVAPLPAGGGIALYLEDCYNASLFDDPIDIDFTNDSTIVMLGWYGDLSVSNMSAGGSLTCYGYGKLTIAASCTGGTIKHGSHVEINDLASGAVTTELVSEAGPLSTDGNTAVAAAVWANGTRTLTALDEDTTTLDLDATIRSAVGLATANLDTQLADLPTVAEFNARTLAAADYATAAALDAVDNYVDTEIAAIQTTLAALFTTALTESYAADGATQTVAQLLYKIDAHLSEVAITGTEKRLNKLDGTTQAMTFALNSATTPTAITRDA